MFKPIMHFFPQEVNIYIVDHSHLSAAFFRLREVNPVYMSDSGGGRLMYVMHLPHDHLWLSLCLYTSPSVIFWFHSLLSEWIWTWTSRWRRHFTDSLRWCLAQESISIFLLQIWRLNRGSRDHFNQIGSWTERLGLRPAQALCCIAWGAAEVWVYTFIYVSWHHLLSLMWFCPPILPSFCNTGCYFNRSCDVFQRDKY